MRLLLVGGGCRGLALTRSLTAEGHAVRVVTRSPERRAAIEAAGGECWIGDPDRVGTLRYALDNVTILLWALPSVPDLHAGRLEMMLERTVDTMVRGVIYERAGLAGEAIVERLCTLNEVPYRFVERGASDWPAAARAAIDELLLTAR